MAEKFSQLPDVIESQMSEYWIARTLEYMHGEALSME